MTTTFEVVVEAPAWTTCGFDVQAASARALEAAAGALSAPREGGAAIAFCDDARMKDLNARHRNVDAPTNVLAFPAAGRDGWLGDIAVALETAQRESDEKDVSLHDHVSHLLVHAFLHLQGYDHQSEDDAITMEDLERRALARLNISDPYQEAPHV